MKTVNEKIRNANTATAEGRQLVAEACKSFYHEIEEDVHKVGSDAEWSIQGPMRGEFCRAFLQ